MCIRDRKISKGIFRDVPDECLFTSSALQVYKTNSETHHWHLLYHPLCLLFPQHRFELGIGFIDPPSEESEEEYEESFLVVLDAPREPEGPLTVTI